MLPQGPPLPLLSPTLPTQPYPQINQPRPLSHGCCDLLDTRITLDKHTRHLSLQHPLRPPSELDRNQRVQPERMNGLILVHIVDIQTSRLSQFRHQRFLDHCRCISHSTSFT